LVEELIDLEAVEDVVDQWETPDPAGLQGK
jgi:hypothetical protein